eukprot:366434-Chlamydomonas_euryale.AAC.4
MQPHQRRPLSPLFPPFPSFPPSRILPHFPLQLAWHTCVTHLEVDGAVAIKVGFLEQPQHLVVVQRAAHVAQPCRELVERDGAALVDVLRAWPR